MPSSGPSLSTRGDRFRLLPQTQATQAGALRPARNRLRRWIRGTQGPPGRPRSRHAWTAGCKARTCRATSKGDVETPTLIHSQGNSQSTSRGARISAAFPGPSKQGSRVGPFQVLLNTAATTEGRAEQDKSGPGSSARTTQPGDVKGSQTETQRATGTVRGIPKGLHLQHF